MLESAPLPPISASVTVEFSRLVSATIRFVLCLLLCDFGIIYLFPVPASSCMSFLYYTDLGLMVLVAFARLWLVRTG
jgi:hypothetical protein